MTIAFLRQTSNNALHKRLKKLFVLLTVVQKITSEYKSVVCIYYSSEVKSV